MPKMNISPKRINDIICACDDFRKELERLHEQGTGENGCKGWPDCDCRLAEQIRFIVHIRDEWQYRAANYRPENLNERGA
jgi:hypothetical protein